LRWVPGLRIDAPTMKHVRRILLLAPLALALVPAANAARLARECKIGVCKKAINRCVKQSCAGFRGPIKAGCVRAARLTIRTSCNLAEDHTDFCNQVAAEPCTPDR